MAITVKHSKVSTVPDGDDTSVVRPSDWNNDHVLTGTVPVANGGTGAATLTGYVKGNGTSAMTAASTIPNTDITGLGTASTKDAGSANGVATLDSGGKVPISELPAAVIGALSYQGTWNASTNTPTLTSSVGTKGYYYVVSVAGSTNLNGITDWLVGDWAVYNGSAWQKIDNTDAVTSVNGYTGAVTLTYTDVGAFPATSTTGSGNVVLATGATQANPTISNYENFTPTTAPAYSEGRVWYDSTEKALAFYNDSSALAVHVSQDLIFKVINNTGSTIANGAPVYITGTSSGQTYPNVALAKADVAATASVIGLTNGAIANGATGYVSSQGTIDNVNTSTFTVGQVLYLSPYSAGQLMNTVPPTGITVQVGIATYIDSSAGHIYVKQTTPLAVPASIITGTLGVPNGGTGATTLTGYVKGSGTSALTAASTIPTTDLSGTITNAQLANSAITINGTSTSLGGSISVGTVTSVAATAGTGISVSGSPITGSGTLTVTNTAPDQTVVLTAGTGISTSGTYPNFTITNTSPSSGGTVTSVTGTAPVVSSGGNTPAISMAAATTSVNGYLTSTDWTTFNGKQATLVSGTNIKTINTNSILGSGDLTISASPAGSTTQVQYNNAGAFAGSAGFLYTASTGILSLTGSTGALAVPSGTTAQRPSSLVAGMIRYNTTTNETEIYNGVGWTSVTYQTYSVSYLVVAGGGGGGGMATTASDNGAGGGGAGGLLASTATLSSGTSYSITVGAGGSGGASGGNNGTAGSNSVFGSVVTATGGGYGARTGTGGSGGSGGGGGWTSGSGGAATSGQGFAGGNGVGSPTNAAGGGGGASAVGGNASGSTPSALGGNGGAGTSSSISGSAVTYAGGGGGGSYLGTGGSGGSGGGGAGTAGGAAGGAGTANLGGGGGGASAGVSAYAGGNGGSGVVIISYAGSQKGTGGTVTSVGGNTIHTFTSSSTYTA